MRDSINVSFGWMPRGKKEIKEDLDVALKRLSDAKNNYKNRSPITVGKLIEKLEKLDKNLPIALVDWNENYQMDNATVTSNIKNNEGFFSFKEAELYGRYISIG